jgi:hypothetical protein
MKKEGREEERRAGRREKRRKERAEQKRAEKEGGEEGVVTRVPAPPRCSPIHYRLSPGRGAPQRGAIEQRERIATRARAWSYEPLARCR